MTISLWSIVQSRNLISASQHQKILFVYHLLLRNMKSRGFSHIIF